MKVFFFLPALYHGPVGGYKVVFAHANGLSERGHSVSVYYPLDLRPASRPWDALWRIYQCWRVNTGRAGDAHRSSLAQRVQVRMVPDLRSTSIRQRADMVVATAWQTAEFVSAYPAEYGAKVYLVQDYEHYMSGSQETRDRISATYQCGMVHVAVAPVIAELVKRTGAGEVHLVENGIDLDTYHAFQPVESPGRCMVGFPTRPEVFKRTEDAVAAVGVVRRDIPGLRAWSFGGPRPKYIPEWVEYRERPSDADLCHMYNQTAVFLTPSEYEGWGLPGSEAMACGAALVSADHGGVRAYAQHGVTAILTAPRDVDAMASETLRLLRDPARRVELARRGCAAIQRFTWPTAVAQFERVLLDTLGQP